MATISSDESILVPQDFNFSSSLESGSRSSPNRTKCSLCLKLKSKLYCVWCINSGTIVHSSSNNAESLFDKQVKLNDLKVAAKICENNCKVLFEKKQRADCLTSQIRQAKERIKLLKTAIHDKHLKKIRRTNELKILIDHNAKRNARFPLCQGRIDSLLDNCSWKVHQNEELNKKLDKAIRELKEVARLRIKELEFIFPITVIQPKSSSIQSSDIERELAEARHTAFVENRWIYTDRSSELQHCIVAPLLPGSGDYSGYRDYIAAQNRDDVPSSSSSTEVKDNVAHRISSALTYLVQYIIMISYYLDTRFPNKMSISEFSMTPKSVAQFDRRISRLNRNILYLCFVQNTDVTKLSATATVHNVLQLLNTEVTDLGRSGAMEVSAASTANLEKAFTNDGQISEDSDSEDSDALTEWEAVPRMSNMDIPSSAILASQQMTASQSNSIAGSLVTSAAAGIASLWRGWTTGR